MVFKSPNSYYKLLKEARISWQKAQKKHPRQDPEIVRKRVQEIKAILEELMPDIRAEKLAVYAIDEVHLLVGNLIRSHVIPLQMRIHRDVTFPSQSVVQAGVSRGDRRTQII